MPEGADWWEADVGARRATELDVNPVTSMASRVSAGYWPDPVAMRALAPATK